MRIHAVDVDGVDLAVRSWADGGVPFLFWHSLSPAGHGGWLDVATPALVAAGLRPLALDAPGYGRSATLPADRYGVEQLAGLLWALSDTLELERPILAGHSWGGAIAVAAAAQRSSDTRALVLFDSGHVDYADWPEAELDASLDQLVAECEAEAAELSSWDALHAEIVEARLEQPWTVAAFREGVREDESGFSLRVTPAVRGASLYGLIRARPSSSWPALADAGTPTLLILATEPEQVRVANDEAVVRFEAALPQASVERVPGLRHNVFADLGPRAGEMVARWLVEQGLV